MIFARPLHRHKSGQVQGVVWGADDPSVSSFEIGRCREGQISQAAYFAASAHDGVKDQAAHAGQRSQDHEASHEDRGGEAWNEPCLDIGDDQRCRQDDPRRREQRRDDAEEEDRLFDAIKREDGAQDAPAIAIGR